MQQCNINRSLLCFPDILTYHFSFTLFMFLSASFCTVHIWFGTKITDRVISLSCSPLWGSSLILKSAQLYSNFSTNFCIVSYQVYIYLDIRFHNCQGGGNLPTWMTHGKILISYRVCTAIYALAVSSDIWHDFRSTISFHERTSVMWYFYILAELGNGCFN